MTSPTTAARDAVHASQRLMDGMLAVEDNCFTRLDAGLQQAADATRERIESTHHLSPPMLAKAELLPDDRWLASVLLPPVSELVALARERAVAMVGRQLSSVASMLGPHAMTAAENGMTAARRDAGEIERLVYRGVEDALISAAGVTRAAIIEQRKLWLSRHEELPALVARLCSAERVGLPGSSRGAVWALRARMHAASRAASVDTCNAVLLTGMRAWNERADPEPAA